MESEVSDALKHDSVSVLNNFAEAKLNPYPRRNIYTIVVLNVLLNDGHTKGKKKKERNIVFDIFI